MCDRNFKRVYKPEKELSFDEGCCPYKGRFKFKVYNPMRANRFHIKLFQVCEVISRYILRFSVYTGKNGMLKTVKLWFLIAVQQQML